VVKLALELGPIKEDNNFLPEALLLVGAIPAVGNVLLKKGPQVVKAVLGVKGMGPGMAVALAPAVGTYIMASNTGREFEEAGHSRTAGTTASTLTTLELGNVATDSPSTTKAIGGRVKNIVGSVGDAIVSVVKPNRKAAIQGLKSVPNVVRHAGGAVLDLHKGAKNVGKGLVAEAAGTALAGVTLETLAHTGAMKGILDKAGADISQDDIEKHTRDFSTTEILGETVPNLDPVTSVMKSQGAVENLYDVNVTKGLHGDTSTDVGKFVATEISEELGGGLVAQGVGAVAGSVTGGVHAAGQGVESTFKWLGDRL